MDFIENKQNWKTGESSFWEFIILLWIVTSVIILIIIFSFKIYLIPKFQEYKIKHPQTKTKVLNNKKKTNIIKDTNYNSILNKQNTSPISHYESTVQTEVNKKREFKPTNEERKREKLRQKELKQQVKREKKEAKAETKRIKQEKKLQQKFEKQKLKKEKKKFTKIDNDERNIEKNDIENSSLTVEEKEKGEE